MAAGPPLRGHLRWSSVLTIVLLSVAALVSLAPLWWMLVTALMKPALTLEFPPRLLPIPATLDNFGQVLVLRFQSAHARQDRENAPISGSTRRWKSS